MDKLKRVVIKQELLELTGDYKKAIILNQLIYWSERVSDFDKFIKEEKERCNLNNIENNQQLQNGWLYKSCEELSDETMLGLSKSNMGVHIKYLIEKGWISERQNPVFKWDRTKQYRVNIVNIQKDLFYMGYSLEGYPLPSDLMVLPSSEIEHGENEHNSKVNKTEHRSSKTEHPSHEIEHQNSNIERRNTQNETAIPEITSEITSEITLSQSVSHEEDGQTDDQKKYSLNDFQNLISSLEINSDEKNMLIKAYEDILTSEQRKKNINKLLDENVIKYALEKFKKVDKRTVKNPQKYFTSILYNSILEISAKKIIDTNVIVDNVENTIEKNINKFHNFESKLSKLSPEELKNIGRRNFERHLKSIGIDIKNIKEDDFNKNS